jgi:hypothetical protein
MGGELEKGGIEDLLAQAPHFAGGPPSPPLGGRIHAINNNKLWIIKKRTDRHHHK